MNFLKLRIEEDAIVEVDKIPRVSYACMLSIYWEDTQQTGMTIHLTAREARQIAVALLKAVVGVKQNHVA